MWKIITTLTLLFIVLMDLKSGNKADNIQNTLDSFMSKCEEIDLFSGTVLAEVNGKVIFEKSYGYSDREKNILNSSDTKYNIGSIGKLFTAVLILQLAQENKISLNDNIGKYLSVFSQDVSQNVSISNLLKHNSGFGDYINNPEFMQNREKYRENSDLLTLIAKEQLLFPPGQEFSYSNSGYVILGAVVEMVTGKSYAENLKERILKPLEMNFSGFHYIEDNDPLMSVGYIKDIKGIPSDNNRFVVQPSPAGGMYSTAGDLLKFDHSLMNDNKLLSDNYKIILLNDFDELKDVTFAELKSKSRNAYAGGAPGINAVYVQYPSENFTVMILSNYDFAAEAIEGQITNIIKGNDFEMPRIPLGQFLYNTLESRGQEYFTSNLNNIITDNGYKIQGDHLLNNIGYQFLQNNLIQAAIDIFTLNTGLFPETANCFDSLGEAYLISGNKDEAVKNYRIVLSLDPGNENAKKMIEKIK